ncbi:MAG: ABC transporter permease subunit [Hyphomicrobiales bacterium]
MERLLRRHQPRHHRHRPSPTGYSILGNSSTAMAGVLLAEIWQWTPFMVLIMLAGLRSLPKEPFEAAAIDGATPVQAFSFKLDASHDVQGHRRRRAHPRRRSAARLRLYQGDDRPGPGTATETMTSYAGRIYFGNADFPLASTVALLTLILVIITSTVFMRIFSEALTMEMSRPWRIACTSPPIW